MRSCRSRARTRRPTTASAITSGAWAKKRAFAAMVTGAGLPLTVNAVVSRPNLHQVGQFIDLALELGARRLEVAHTQYYGWALQNRAALMPPRKETEEAIRLVEAARARLAGRLVIDMVVPDYYARYPKPCAGGWGRLAINVSPSGKVAALPRGGDDPGPRVLERARPIARRNLELEPGLQRLSRDGLDARALPILRAAGDRLGRLPLPGAGARRRRRLRPTRPARSRRTMPASRRWRKQRRKRARARSAGVRIKRPRCRRAR